MIASISTSGIAGYNTAGLKQMVKRKLLLVQPNVQVLGIFQDIACMLALSQGSGAPMRELAHRLSKINILSSGLCYAWAYIACRAGVFLVSERLDFLCEMFDRYPRFFRQRKVGERNKLLPWGWLIGMRKEGEGKENTFNCLLACPNVPPPRLL